MLHVIAVELDEDAPRLDPRIPEPVARAVSFLNSDGHHGGDVVITDTHGRVLRVVQYEVCGEINVVELESQAWY